MERQQTRAEEISAFLDGKIDRFQSSVDHFPHVTPEVAAGITARVRAIDWFLALQGMLRKHSRTSVPDEAFQRDRIRDALGEVYRAYTLADYPLLLPPNRTIVEAICPRLAWFEDLDPNERRRTYLVIGEEIAALRSQTVSTVAASHDDETTRASAQTLERNLAKETAVLDALDKEAPELAETFRLSQRAGRLSDEIAELLDITHEAAKQYLREAEVEIRVRE